MKILDNIKLIIWDLDETFWQGTLSEGTIFVPNENIEIINRTTDAGVINSICSKNDFDSVHRVLVDKGLNDLFVFASISWEPKGKRIKEQIQRMGLRPINVLFIDDNPQNLEEAKFYCKDLNILNAANLNKLYCEVLELDEKDVKHKRLKQYKVLEAKDIKKAEYSSNEDFLYSCNIKVTVYNNCAEELDRIHDLIMRSNQLNFTKVRLSKEELTSLINDCSIQKGYVTVKDNFGDYGIVGFYAKKDDKLIHFTFSCRTLGMGVEQYVYNLLGKPEINIIGEVASSLNAEKPKWINRDNTVEANCSNKENVKAKILFKGPCDMSQIFSFIVATDNISTEFTYINSKEASIEGHNHTVGIKTALTIDSKSKEEMMSFAPWLDSTEFDTVLKSSHQDYIFLSMFTDSNLGLYRCKDNGHFIALCEKKYDLTNKDNWDKYINKKVFTSNIDFTVEKLKVFSDHFEFVDNSDYKYSIEALDYLTHFINDNQKLYLLLGSEKEFKKPTYDSYANRHHEHRIFNQKLEAFARSHSNVFIIKIDDFIKNDSDFLDTINHFVKRVYFDLATHITTNITNDAKHSSKMKLWITNIELKIRSLIKKIVGKK